MSEPMNREEILVLLGQAGYQARKTGFIGNGIAIDPADCGCTDCCVGNAYPEGTLSPEVILEALAMNRPIYDRRT